MLKAEFGIVLLHAESINRMGCLLALKPLNHSINKVILQVPSERQYITYNLSHTLERNPAVSDTISIIPAVRHI